MLPSWLVELLNQLAPVVQVTAILMVNSVAKRVRRIERHLNIPPDDDDASAAPAVAEVKRASTNPGLR
jgi:hypothetical protein